MVEEKIKNQDPLKLGNRLHLDDLTGRAEKPPHNLVPRKKRSLGTIRTKKIHGRIYYSWVRTEYRGAGLSPRQVIVKYIGTQLPPGVRLGPVDIKTAKKLLGVKEKEEKQEYWTNAEDVPDEHLVYIEPSQNRRIENYKKTRHMKPEPGYESLLNRVFGKVKKHPVKNGVVVEANHEEIS